MTRFLPLVPLLVATGCMSGAVDFSTEPTVDPSVELAGGVFELESDFDLTAASVLPEPVADTLDVLLGLRQNPAATLMGVLDDAGVPLVDDLYGALPNALSSRIESWMNSAISRTPLAEVLDMITAQAELVLTRFTLVSEIELELAQACMPTQHTLREFRYDIGSTTLVVPIADLPATPLTSTDLTACVSASDSADAQLALDAHSFGLPYGQAAYVALEMAVQETMGDDLRGVISTTIDCPGVAASVANKCVLGLCVGHQQLIEQLCEAGVDEVVSRLRARMEALDFEAVRLASGVAELVDLADTADGVGDGVVDRIEAGIWDASIDFGLGPRSVPARFRGQRLP